VIDRSHISVHCYQLRGNYPPEPKEKIPAQPWAEPAEPARDIHELVAREYQEWQSRFPMKSVFWIYTHQGNFLIEDGAEIKSLRMLPLLYKFGLQTCPPAQELLKPDLSRERRELEVPLPDWEIMRDHLPAPWRARFYFPWAPSELELAGYLHVVLWGAYGYVRARSAMRSEYKDSPAFSATCTKWRRAVAWRAGLRTSFALLVLGLLPDVSRILSCYTQRYFTEPKGVAICSMVEMVSLLCATGFLIRNCHYWVVPLFVSYSQPKDVVMDLLS